MEATTYETAALIDRGAEDYMLETAILKVFSTEALWQGVYETLQVHGGQGYFTDEPYERMMRDARINTIGEGANEVLKAFIALVGMRDIGEGFKATLEGLKRPGPVRCRPSGGSAASGSAGWRGRRRSRSPRRSLRPDADALARRVARFAWAVERVLIKHREADPRTPVRPGADRRRRDRAGDRRRAPSPGSTATSTASTGDRRRPRRRPSSTSGWPTAGSTRPSATSTTTTTPDHRRRRRRPARLLPVPE